MLKELPFAQFREWQAFDQIEPIGGIRGDWQVASVCATVMNALHMRVGSRERFSPSDFMLKFDSVVKEAKKDPAKVQPARTRYTQTWQEQKMIGMMFAAASQSRANNRKKR